MDDSETQFQELMAQLIVMTNRTLEELGQALPLGLIVKPNAEVEALVWSDPSEDVTGEMQAAMVSSVAEADALATAMCVPQVGGKILLVLLENHENYCAQVMIPIVGQPPRLDAENLDIDDGPILIFPLLE